MNCHLAAHACEMNARIQDYTSIVKNLKFRYSTIEAILDHELVKGHELVTAISVCTSDYLAVMLLSLLFNMHCILKACHYIAYVYIVINEINDLNRIILVALDQWLTIPII